MLYSNIVGVNTFLYVRMIRAKGLDVHAHEIIVHVSSWMSVIFFMTLYPVHVSLFCDIKCRGTCERY